MSDARPREGRSGDGRLGVAILGSTGSIGTTALRVIDIEQVVFDLVARNLKRWLPIGGDQGTDRPVRLRSADSTVASAPMGSANSTS